MKTSFCAPGGEIVEEWGSAGVPEKGDTVYLQENDDGRFWRVVSRCWFGSISVVLQVTPCSPRAGEHCEYAPANAPGHKPTGAKGDKGVRSCTWCGLDVYPGPGEEFAGEAQEDPSP